VTAADDLTLEFDGHKLTGWAEIRVTRSLDHITSDFEIAVTEKYPNRDAVAVKAGQPCRVMLGDDLVITGYVDRVTTEFDTHSHRVRVAGRGKLQDAVDCAAIWPNGQIVYGTLEDISEKLLKVYGIGVMVQTDTGGPIPKQILNIGDSVFDVLEPIARYRALLMYEDTSGDLILSGVGTAHAASGFVEGKNVEAAGIAYSMDQRYSLYSAYRVKVLALKDSGGESNLIADIQDPGVPRFRAKYFVAETFDGGFDVAQRRALWEGLRRVARSASVHVVCDSWRDAGGALWTPNTLATIELPSLKLPKAQWMIAEVSYIRNAGGTHAQLVLMAPEAFAPQPTNLLKISNKLAAALGDAAAQGAPQ
jgi:prophage tail gpP-like protein